MSKERGYMVRAQRVGQASDRKSCKAIDSRYTNSTERQPAKDRTGKIQKGGMDAALMERQWKQLYIGSRGEKESTSRHVGCKARGSNKTNTPFPRFLVGKKLDPAMKRAMVRWTIYNFPVRYKPKEE